MNYIECKSAIAAPLHLVPSHEEPAHTFKDAFAPPPLPGINAPTAPSDSRRDHRLMQTLSIQ